MSYLVRKLVKRSNIDVLKDIPSRDEISADVITSEFRTKDNTLSTWRISSAENLEDAILAIATTSSRIETMDFIVIEIGLIEEHQLFAEYSDPGSIPMEAQRTSHHDLKDLNLNKLGNIAFLYKHIAQEQNTNPEKELIKRYRKKELSDLILKALEEGKLNLDNATSDMKEAILKLRQVS